MASERAQAISVANRYFSLVDGMIPGFKDHLAKHVILKWFGRVIKGRENVTDFILSNQMESFHTFSDITSVSGISYENEQLNRKIKRFLDHNANCETYSSNYLRKAPARSSHETEMSTTHENVKDCGQKNNTDNRDNAAFIHETAGNECEFNIEKCLGKLKISKDRDDVNQNEFSAKAIAEMDDRSYDVNKNDLCKLFEPEITESQPIVGKIQNINRIKLKEEMAPTIRAINTEGGQGDGPVTAEANAIKYLEANGEIKFVRLNTQTDSLFLYHRSKLWQKKFWKRQCKLVIAYSLIVNDDDSSQVVEKFYSAQRNASSARFSKLSTKVRNNVDQVQNSKLPSLEEAIQISNTLIRDVNYFGGYLQPVNFLEDRENFLKSFQADITQKNPKINFAVHYVGNKLTFDFSNKKPINVMYKIHEIVYSRVEVCTSNTQETASGN